MKFAATLAAALLLAGPAQAEDWADDPGYAADPGYAESRGLCRAVKDRQPPAADRPTAAQAQALKGCSSETLYYGIGMAADPVKARQCAFIEAQTPDDGGFFDGVSMLMTIYANGVGAKRDLDLATHFACSFAGAPAENDGRVKHLQAMKTDKALAAKGFDLCDDVTSGMGMGFCAAHGADVADARRAAALAAMTSRWTPAERAALAPLLKARDAYIDAHVEGEVDLSGSGRVSFSIDASEAAKDEFETMLQALSAGRAPTFTAAQYAAQDAKLNAAYKQARAFEPGDMGTVTREGILGAQRAWLKYRDAFVAFAGVKFPGAGSDSVAAWMTQMRTKTLSDG